uniref:T9SS type A sorting domain-containing protein n=1 Tax=Seonamhaeicola maritimus TaxID=2591822 RepID=UPI0024959960
VDINPDTVWYLDADGDDYAVSTMTQCTSPGAGYTTIVLPLTDCNDGDAAINPGATEILDNGVDDDCNPNTGDTLSIEEFNLKNFKILPNPFNTELFIHIPETFQNETFHLRLYNILGELIMEKKWKNTSNRVFKLEKLGTLQEGVYVLKIILNTSNKSIVKSVVKY